MNPHEEDTGVLGWAISKMMYDCLVDEVKTIWVEELTLRVAEMGWPLDRVLWECREGPLPQHGETFYMVQVIYLDHPNVAPHLSENDEYKHYYPEVESERSQHEGGCCISCVQDEEWDGAPNYDDHCCCLGYAANKEGK